MSTNRLLMPLAMLALIGVGSFVLQRWVAGTFLAAIVLSVAWGLIVGLAFLAHSLRHRRLLVPTLLALGFGGLVAVGGFWYFSVRDVVVDEDIVVATAEAEPGTEGGRAPGAGPGPREPVALAHGRFRGEDGHDGSGVATVVETPDGDRLLTFSRFDVSPAPDIDVYLTPTEDGVDDRVSLGDLKGNIGDQQYEIPAGTDLGRYDTVLLWCVSFTVRIAVAPLSA